MKTFAYKQTPQGALNLLVDFPPGWKAGDARPSIVFFFGGGWAKGDVGQFQPQAEYFASRGLVAVRVEYRIKGKHGTRPDASVEDARSAMRWVRGHAAELGVDPVRIVGSGGSAGGHLAASTALLDEFDAPADDMTVSPKPNLLVLFNPVLDTAALGGRFGFEDLGERLSPHHHLRADTPPAILFFGDQDEFLEPARDYARKAADLGAAAEVWVAAGVGHAFFNRSPWRERTMELADRFLVRHGYLGGAPTVAVPPQAEMSREPLPAAGSSESRVK